MFKSKFKILFAAFFLLSGNLCAQSLSKYAGEFLALGVGSRSLGMGSAYVAVARDVSAG